MNQLKLCYAEIFKSTENPMTETHTIGNEFIGVIFFGRYQSEHLIQKALDRDKAITGTSGKTLKYKTQEQVTVLAGIPYINSRICFKSGCY